MRIFLVRHGQSRANLDWKENKRVADHAIELSEEGKKQARAAGEFLAGWFDDAWGDGGAWIPVPRVRLWHSPYTRTRQTAQEIERVCVCSRGIANMGVHEEFYRKKGQSWFVDVREHLLLAEQQFGIFDGLSDDERREQYPDMQAYYQKCKDFEGKIWPKMPLGESRFEVCQRVHQAFGTFHRDARKHEIENLVIVGHGTTNRAFIMMWLHLPYEWMHEEPNPKNCSIRLLEDGEDKGYIFEGFEHAEGYKHKANRETEE